MRTLTIERAARPAAGIVAAVMAIGLAGCGQEKVELAHQEVLATFRTVAVLPFVDAPGDDATGSGQIVVNAVIAQLYQCPGMRVVERGRIDALMDEHDLKLAGITSDDATRLGKLAGADAVFLGEVTQYEAQQEYGHMNVNIIGGGSTKHIHRVGLSVRAINVADGTVVYADLGQGTDKGGFSEAAKSAAESALKSWKAFYARER